MPRDLNFEVGSGTGQRMGHGEDDENDPSIGPDGRRKSLTSRMFGMRKMWIEGTYDQGRSDGHGFSEDGKFDIVGERCRALADAAKRMADTLRAEPRKVQSPRKHYNRNLFRHGELDRNCVVDNFLGRTATDDDTASEAWSPANATECEPTPHMEAHPLPTPGGGDLRSGAQNAQTPIQSRFLAGDGGADMREQREVRFGGGAGSARMSPTHFNQGGYAPEFRALGGAGRLPPADLDQQGQPLQPPSPDNILQDLASQIASLREEVMCEREAQRHEAHVRQVGLLTDASVKVPGKPNARGARHNMKGMMDPGSWNEHSLASSRAASTLEFGGGAEVGHRLKNLTDRVGQLYAEVHHGAGKCLCRYMPEGMACSYCLESKADGFASSPSMMGGAGRVPY